MPINIPDNLPAFSTLEKENIFVMHQERATSQDIRPLRIAILNLMPTKVETEIQLLRLLSNTPLQIDITLSIPSTHESKHTSVDYLNRFYRTFDSIESEYFDGMIITGAPLEDMDYEDVDYWDEMCNIMEWTDEHVFSTMHICWAAMAGLYYHHGINKIRLPKKKSGVYRYRNMVPSEPLMRGIDDYLVIPQSRYAAVRKEDIDAVPELEIAAMSDDGDPGIVVSDSGRVFITGHMEYDTNTLAYEYSRDVDRGLDPSIPENYFPGDDSRFDPVLTWRSHSTLIFSNWLNYYVYQQTPYDIRKINGRKRK